MKQFTWLLLASPFLAVLTGNRSCLSWEVDTQKVCSTQRLDYASQFISIAQIIFGGHSRKPVNTEQLLKLSHSITHHIKFF